MEVCTPSLSTTCTPLEVVVKRVVEREQCQQVTTTVCSIMEERLENKVCSYSYQPRYQEAETSTVGVTFKKECMAQVATVCHGYGYCQEEEQETCYNSPVVTPRMETVTLTLPEAVVECEDKPIMLPRVTCKDMVEQRCFLVPDLEEGVEMVEQCEVMAGAPSCRMVELVLPQQVCKGHAYI